MNATTANVIAVDPELEQAWQYLNAGNLAKAAELAEILSSRKPQDHAVLQFSALVAKAQNRLPEAAELFKRALNTAADNVNAAMSWTGLGQALRSAGDLRQAQEAFRRAVLIDPSTLSHKLEFAQTLADAGRLEEALVFLQTAERQHPGDPRAALQRGNLLLNANRHAEALAAYEAGLAQDGNSVLGHLNRCTALVMLGRLDEALQACETGLRLDPKMDGYYHLSLLKPLPRDDEHFKLLEQWVQTDTDASIESHIDRCFALANAYEGQGDYARAFETLAKANRMKRSTLTYEIATEEARIDNIISFFTQDFFARFAGKKTSDLAPVFIIGMPRSGSTLVEQILAAHPAVRAGGEMIYMLDICKRIGENWGARGEASPGSDAEVIADLTYGIETYTRLTESLHPGNSRFTDKLLSNFMFVGLIHLMFPRASIIHCRRDPVDVCLSCYKQLFSSELNWSYELGELGRYYRGYERLMNHWQTLLPGRILDVQYESVIKDPEAEIRRLLDFCNLEFDPRCLDFHAVQRTVTTASATQVRKPLYTTSINRWERYRDQLAPLLAALGLPEDYHQSPPQHD